MSKPIPEEEYNRKPLTPVIRWVMGEADPYLGNVEMRRPRDNAPSEGLVQSHRKDREEVIEQVFDREHNRVLKGFNVFYRFTAVLCCVALIAMLLVAVYYLPPVGHADNPTSNEVAARYIESGLQETGAVNIVTGMILDYRAFDTFGESNVLFIATCTVLILLRDDQKKKKKLPDPEEVRERRFEPGDDIILQRVTFILFPIIMIFGIYVILNGHLSPGGGFSGGAIMGAGLILFLNAHGYSGTKGVKLFGYTAFKWVSFGALSFYCLSKCYSFFTGANHLPSIIGPGTPGSIFSAGLILPLNVAVGFVVAFTMFGFYTLFRKGDF